MAAALRWTTAPAATTLSLASPAFPPTPLPRDTPPSPPIPAERSRPLTTGGAQTQRPAPSAAGPPSIVLLPAQGRCASILSLSSLIPLVPTRFVLIRAPR